MMRFMNPTVGGILAGLLMGPFFVGGSLAPPVSLHPVHPILLSQIIDPNPPQPLDQFPPGPPTERSPRPPTEESPRPPTEESPRPPIRENPRPPIEHNPIPPIDNSRAPLRYAPALAASVPRDVRTSGYPNDPRIADPGSTPHPS